MVKFIEKGHNLSISGIIVHKVNKTAGVKATVLKLAEAPLTIGEQEIHFVADVRNSFQDRSRPTYGIFAEDGRLIGFRDELAAYTKSEIDFLTFTKKATGWYENEIRKSAPATGAFIVYADFLLKDNKDRYLLIFSINNKRGYNLSEEQLTIAQILSLDLSKLDVAAMINVSKWQRYLQAADENARTYLSFIRGKKNLSDYFMDFIGCLDKSTSADSSRALVTAVNKFLADRGIVGDEAKAKKKSVFDYCQGCIKEKKEVFLDQISFLLDEENPGDFATFAASEDYGVSEVIKPDKGVLRTLSFIEYRSTDLTLIFNNTLLKSKKITFNKEKHTLLIKDLPEELITQLDRNG